MAWALQHHDVYVPFYAVSRGWNKFNKDCAKIINHMIRPPHPLAQAFDEAFERTSNGVIEYNDTSEHTARHLPSTTKRVTQRWTIRPRSGVVRGRREVRHVVHARTPSAQALHNQISGRDDYITINAGTRFIKVKGTPLAVEVSFYWHITRGGVSLERNSYRYAGDDQHPIARIFDKARTNGGVEAYRSVMRKRPKVAMQCRKSWCRGTEATIERRVVKYWLFGGRPMCFTRTYVKFVCDACNDVIHEVVDS